MRRLRKSWIIAVCFALGVLLISIPLQDSIATKRSHLFRKDIGVDITRISGPTPVMIAALGGFRQVAADLLWLKVDHLWDGGSWYLLPPLMESVVQLDPHFVTAWILYGWHLAYNLNAESVTIVDRDAWLQDGMKVLQRGVEANPRSWEMLFELAWTQYDRAHDLLPAANNFRKASDLPGAKPYVSRLTYRPYEHLLDFTNLGPALKYAKTQHLDDNSHQLLVSRDTDWWTQHWNDPQEHRRQIVNENTARKQRAIRYELYPDDPYWNVCPLCGLPTKKGEKVCSVCGKYEFSPEQNQPVTSYPQFSLK